MKVFNDIGLGIPEFWLPRKDINLLQWAVIACDQFTSEMEYWEQVEKTVGDAPSTLRLTLPEIFLGKPDEQERIAAINSSMEQYLKQGILERHEGMVYIERTVAGKTRRGLLVCLDLEKYDFNKGSTSLIRATEGTILDRLPPRIKIREHSQLELPHILVLMDDPRHTVIQPLSALKGSLKPLYDFDLMLGSGHISGWKVDDEQMVGTIVANIRNLADLPAYRQKYNLPGAESVLLYAMGDGNHSLATAKAIWERSKATVGMDHPCRYALVELENVHDTGLEFEPIHRVLFGVKTSLQVELQQHFGNKVNLIHMKDIVQLEHEIALSSAQRQRFGMLDSEGFTLVELDHPPLNLPVGNLQALLDGLLKSGKAGSIDYVHGVEAVEKLGRQETNAGFLLPGMDKSDLFKTVIVDGALPRKTFSMGEAKEKRFYLEARKIR